MALVTFTIPNLTNGVSQQPVTIRLPNQGQEQINGNCRVTDGLSKRSPTKFIDTEQLVDNTASSVIPLSDSGLAFHKLLGKDKDGNDVLAEIIVRCATGETWLRYVEGPRAGETHYVDTFAYLVSNDQKDIKFLTNGDTTYVLNKTMMVEDTELLETPEADENIQGTLINVAQGFFGTKYKITLKLTDSSDGSTETITATYSTPNSTTSDLTVLRTSSVRSELQTALQNAIDASTGIINAYVKLEAADSWIQAKVGSTGLLTAQRASELRIECEAFTSTASAALFAFNGVLKDIADIPQVAPEGYIIRVAVGGQELDDDYYLKYSRAEGAWLETVRRGLINSIDRTTMPLEFKSILADYTQLSTDHIQIAERKVGDRASNPDPSFVGYSLNDMFIFYNRLGFLSRNNVILSEIDHYDTFYRTTVASSKVSDRVDITASVPSTRYTDINFAVPFDKELVLFGEAAQYSLSANTGFDVRTANLSTLTEYESDKRVSPLNIGASIYFPIIRGKYTAIFDLARRGDIGLTAEEITQHIPVYIQGDIVEMDHSATENMVFLRTADNPKTIYVQNRFVRDRTLEQNAWHKWELPNDVVSLQIIGSRLFVNMMSDDKEHLIRTYVDISLTLIQQTAETEIDFLPYIDKQKRLVVGNTVSTTSGVGDYYVLPEDTDRIVGVSDRGFTYAGVSAINTALETEELWVGTTFTFSYTFSEQVPAMYDSGGKTAMQYAKLSIQSMKIAYANSGKFKIRVKAIGRPEHQSTFSGVILGSPLSIIGRVNINSGVFKFPVHSRAEAVRVTIESDQPYPVTFNTCELQGKLINNSGRM